MRKLYQHAVYDIYTNSLTIDTLYVYSSGMKKLISEINKMGGQAAFARSLGVKQQHVWNWLNRERMIPSAYVLKIEDLTGIPCWEIRPDLYPPERFKKAA